jgi:6-phosphogluconate dehydrogenase
MKELESKGLLFIGTGVSGGEEGALNGPSLMPGGSPAVRTFITFSPNNIGLASCQGNLSKNRS